MTEKQSLRLYAQNLLLSISKERRKEARSALLSLLGGPLNNSKKVLSFFSLATEIDTSLLNEALLNEKRLLLPKLCKDELMPIEMHTLENLVPSCLGVLEPKEGLVVKPEIVLVPALLFDKQGYRLGRGKGFYDKFLSSFTGLSIGIAFKEQLTNELFPLQPHDRAVSILSLF